jgi:hypothetical protein
VQPQAGSQEPVQKGDDNDSQAGLPDFSWYNLPNRKKLINFLQNILSVF